MEDDTLRELIRTIESHIDDGDSHALKADLERQNAGDIAAALDALPDEKKDIVFGLLGDEQASEVLDEVQTATRLDLIEDLDADKLSEIIHAMPPDEAIDLLAEIPEKTAEEVLELFTPEEQRLLERLLSFPPESAGGIMTPAVVKVRDDLTVAQTLEFLRENVRAEEIFYIYAVDGSGRLTGTVSTRKLITAGSETFIRDLMEKELISVPADMDQEDVARLFSRHSLLTIPVVDSGGRLLGQITVDDVMDVLEDEATEDAFKLAGTDDAELRSESAVRIARIRLVWLLICLGGTFLAGMVVRRFESTLQGIVSLTVFIPSIMAMGGNSAIQATAVTVRGIATGSVGTIGILRVVLRELRVASLLGVACGSITGLIAHLWLGNPYLGLVVGVSMFSSVAWASMMGVLLPLTFTRLNIDPAVASGPFITTTNDAVSLLIYFTLVSVLLRHMSL